MSNIVIAINLEQQYQSLHATNPNLSLPILLANEGFSLTDYFRAKREYQLHNCGIRAITAESASQAGSIIQESLSGRLNTYAELGQVESLFIWKGTDDLNETACAEDSINIYQLGYVGGTIVTGREDYNFIFVLDTALDVGGNYFLDRLFRFIRQFETNVVQDNNDILIDGAKVIGAGHIQANNMEVYTTQATFVDHSADIARYCTAPSSKPAGYFRVLTKDQLRTEVMSWVL